jgi:hypothetical protein
MTDRVENFLPSSGKRPVKIVSWMGGEHWYIGRIQFLHLEDAIFACERRGLEYEIVRDPRYLYRNEGD